MDTESACASMVSILSSGSMDSDGEMLVSSPCVLEKTDILGKQCVRLIISYEEWNVIYHIRTFADIDKSYSWVVACGIFGSCIPWNSPPNSYIFQNTLWNIIFWFPVPHNSIFYAFSDVSLLGRHAIIQLISQMHSSIIKHLVITNAMWLDPAVS